jgi:4-carboxymuconolactone decarboxylase
MTPQPPRLPPLAHEQMTAAQRVAADELIAGPRKGVKGPFISLLRSPELLARAQKVGEYLRFGSALPPRLSEFATLVVARQWTQAFEWGVHVPLAIAAGTDPATIAVLREGGRPETMSAEEALVFDFLAELEADRGVSDARYAAAVAALGEHGVLDLLGLVGYFTTISMVLNVARTPADAPPGVAPLPARVPRGC